jgi:predicted TIM-barrel fold metal-dependent hydrolase
MPSASKEKEQAILFTTMLDQVGVDYAIVSMMRGLFRPDYAPMWEYADSKGLLVLVHTWSQCPYSDPVRLLDIAEKYKNVTVLIGHSGGVEPGVTTAIELSNKYENMYLDLTGVFLCSGRPLDYFVSQANPDKLLFSSDAAFNSLTWDIGNVLYARVSEEIKEKVLGLNAQRLLKRFLLR